MSTPTLKERAAGIYELINLVSDELAQAGLPEPSFEHGLPEILHSDAPESKAGNAKVKLLQMVDELRSVLTEPARQLAPLMVNFFIAYVCTM
jgi:hypothetical protein